MGQRYTFRPKEDMMSRLLKFDSNPVLQQYLYAKLIQYSGFRFEGPAILFVCGRELVCAMKAHQTEHNAELPLGRFSEVTTHDFISAIIVEDGAPEDILHDPDKQLEEYRERLKKRWQ